jgi:hypothetical protein
MKVVQANSRVRFTAEDIAFILRVLGRETQDHEFLNLLFADAESRDLILDDPALYEALTSSNHCLPVSMPFYFYVLVRQVFLKAGIPDRSVADYVAALLVEFSRAENLPLRIPPDQSPIEYVFEMLAASAQADARTRFFIQAHIGNHTLFLSGVFSDRIQHRAKQFPGGAGPSTGAPARTRRGVRLPVREFHDRATGVERFERPPAALLGTRLAQWFPRAILPAVQLIRRSE